MLNTLLSREAGCSGSIALSQIEPEIFELMLRHVYTGALPEGDDDTPGMHQHLLAAAERFGVPSLLRAYERSLIAGLSVESVGCRSRAWATRSRWRSSTAQGAEGRPARAT